MKAHYPWRQYRQPWELAISAEVDDSRRTEVCDEETRRIRLDQVDQWQNARLTLDVTTSEVSPTGAGELAVAIVSIPRTNTRIAQPLSWSDGRFGGDLVIAAHEMRGVAELQVQIVDADSGKAVGYTESWKVVGEPGDAPPTPGAPPFEWKWVDFQASSIEVVSQTRNTSKETFSVVDARHQPKPIVYLDESIPGLQAIIESKSPKEEKRRLQNIIATDIASSILRAVARAALDDCLINDDEVTEVTEDPVRLQVLTAIAQELDEDILDLCSDLVVATPEVRAPANRRVELAIDALVGHGALTAAAVGELS